MLSPESIEEFKEIYEQECGEELSDAEALKLATSFFNLMEAIYRPLPGGACCHPNRTVCLSSHTRNHVETYKKASE